MHNFAVTIENLPLKFFVGSMSLYVQVNDSYAIDF